MQAAKKLEVTLKHSNWMKHWLYALLLISMLAIGSLADLHPLFLMLLFPIGVGFNWLFFRFVSLASKSSVVGFEHIDKEFVLIQKDGNRWSGTLVSIPWNTYVLTVIKLQNSDGSQRPLVLFSDSAIASELREFRAWLTISA